MLDVRDSKDFRSALEKAILEFAVTDNEIICIDTKENGEMVNAVILVRGKGITKRVVNMYYSLMNTLDRAREKGEKKK